MWIFNIAPGVRKYNFLKFYYYYYYYYTTIIIIIIIMDLVVEMNLIGSELESVYH